MITGNDELSLKIIKELDSGKTISEIVDLYSITKDQGKKLSRFNTMLKQVNNLPDTLQQKFKLLGLKTLVLSPLFKNNDLEGLQDILQSVDISIKRDTLAKMLLALDEKRKHIKEAQEEISYKMRNLERKEAEIHNKIQELHETEIRINEIFAFLEKASPEAKEFLQEHLGVKSDKIVLAKRLYYTWQQELKREDIIEYDWMSYSWEVKDIDKLIAATEKKLLNKRSRKCMRFDPDKDPWNSSAEYKKVSGAQVNLVKLYRDNKRDLKNLSKERSALKKSIDEIKSKSAMSYMESAILSNQISAKDIETHAMLQDQGMKWLFDQGYVTTSELSHKSYRFDVIGFDNTGSITIIEAKASKEDFQRDTKWHNYLKYCNKFYFIFHEYELYYIKHELLAQIQERGAGILIVKKNKRIELLHNCHFEQDVVEDKEMIIFNTSRSCSKKVLYGY